MLISLISDFTDSFGKFTKQLLLLRLADRIVNFQSSFVSRISRKYMTSIQHLYDVYVASRHDINVVLTSYLYCHDSYYLHNCSTYNSPLCLRSNNIQSVFGFVIIANFFWILHPSFFFKDYWFNTLLMIDSNNVKYMCKNKFS